jgi:transcription initiation factor IIF auxiliary subunit
MFFKELIEKTVGQRKEIIKFNNYAEKIGERSGYDWYKWCVFVDEDETILNEIDYVEYLLHKTFPKPKRIVKDRETKFALESEGWGEFYIFITIFFTKNGEKKEQRYWLSFDKQWPEE